MKFGKQILANQVPGWSKFYLDYKALKKIVSALSGKRNASLSPPNPIAAASAPMLTDDLCVDMATSASRPGAQPPLWEPSRGSAPFTQLSLPVLTASVHDDDRGPTFQGHKTAFFSKLESELTKINEFYLEKEAELRFRLDTLLTKRQSAAQRLAPVAQDSSAATDRVEWRAVEEGFRLVERDLGKLQQFIDINATGFRKILKKWDKRSKSTTKELYLTRQVEVMPCFNRQLISEMSDTVSTCLLDLSNVEEPSGLATQDTILTRQIARERSAHMSAFNDLEDNLSKAVSTNDSAAVQDSLTQAGALAVQKGGRQHVTRILWKAVIDAPPPLADLILASTAVPFDFAFVDDINGRTCLHEAALAGELRLVRMCLARGVSVERADAYVRNALHYAAMNGHPAVCAVLLAARDGRGVGVDPCKLDMDNYSPLIYAVVNGNAECVKVLLADDRVGVEPVAATSDLIPLSLACQFGHTAVAQLLLDRGARILPNSNGEYPLHLAAREGRADLCRVLVQRNLCDVADKYSEWTPLCHAASNGHAECVRILLDAGANPLALDENGKLAVFHAAWNGHARSAELLLEAAGARNATLSAATSPNPAFISPSAATDVASESDMDFIPSLYLPPPIMPFRVYGHNYLDKNLLIQISLGPQSSGSCAPPVELVARLVGSTGHSFAHATPTLRLVVTPRPESSTAPYTVVLPLQEDKDTFSFQVRGLEELSVEFSIYPTLGKKTIGKAVAVSKLFSTQAPTEYTLPILDHRLNAIGQVTFVVCVISPLSSAALGDLSEPAIETYWKSNALQPGPANTNVNSRMTGSAHTSPSNMSAVASGSGGAIASSLAGEYVHVIVQVTRDLVPVVCHSWLVPDTHYTLGVADVAFAQFDALASRLGKSTLKHGQACSAAEWHAVLADTLISLDRLFEAVPSTLGIYAEIAYPTPDIKAQYRLGHIHGLNVLVDAVLSAAFRAAASHSAARDTESLQRRRVVFGSFMPDVCSALKWKQPTCPVFFASACGMPAERLEAAVSPRVSNPDRRCNSVGAAVAFAKANNLLGIIVPANLLMQVPYVMSGINDFGLLLISFGPDGGISSLTGVNRVDAHLCNGAMAFLDQPLKAIM